MQVDFEGLVAQSEATRRRREEREARRRVLLQQRVQDVRKEIAGVFTQLFNISPHFGIHVHTCLSSCRHEVRDRSLPETDGVVFQSPSPEVY